MTRSRVWSAPCVVAGLVLALAGPLNAAVILTLPTDPIVGVAAAPASSVSALSVVGTLANTNNYPAAEAPLNCIDNNTATKYLNFAKTNVGILERPGLGASFLSGVRFATANDSPERDPMQIVIQGANGTDPLVGFLNTTWTTIYTGTSGLDTDPGRTTFGPEVDFPASPTDFVVYRVLVTSVRNATTANSVQFSEIQLIGTPVPEPVMLSLAGMALPLFWFRRRRA